MNVIGKQFGGPIRDDTVEMPCRGCLEKSDDSDAHNEWEVVNADHNEAWAAVSVDAVEDWAWRYLCKRCGAINAHHVPPEFVPRHQSDIPNASILS